MSLLDLPDDVKQRLLADHPEMKGWSIRKAIRTAKATGPCSHPGSEVPCSQGGSG